MNSFQYIIPIHLGVYTLGGLDSGGLHFLGPRIWDLAPYVSSLGVYTLGVYTLGVYTFSGHGFGIWPRTHLGVYTLGVYTLGVFTFSGHGFWI